MEHVLLAILIGLVIYLANCKVIVLRTTTRVKILRVPVSARGSRRVEISGEVTPAAESQKWNAPRSIRHDDDAQNALEAARRLAEAELSSALVNLGCRGPRAREAAKLAMLEGG